MRGVTSWSIIHLNRKLLAIIECQPIGNKPDELQRVSETGRNEEDDNKNAQLAVPRLGDIHPLFHLVFVLVTHSYL